MAFLTKLNNKDINKICTNYNFINCKNITPIYEGIQNSNYIIHNSRKYILTLYEDKNVIKNLEKYIKLLLYLKESKLNCPIPIMSSEKKFISSLNNKKYAIFTFLEGKYLKKYNNNNLYELGANVAIMHRLTYNLNLRIKNNFNLSYFKNNLTKHHKYISSFDKKLIINFNKSINDYRKFSKINLDKGIIHADLFPDNVLYKKGKISGLIDFYYACNHYLITDLAIIIISWCFSYYSNKMILNLDRVKSLLQSYNRNKKLKFEELKLLDILCKIYCIRFFFSRLNDMKKKYDKKYTQIKDPNEYLNKYLFLEKNKLDFKRLLLNE